MVLRPGRRGMAVLFSLRLAIAVALRESVAVVDRVTDAASNTLILLARGPEQWTVLHMDRTEAVNVAFAVASAGLGHALAEWVFISPDALPLLEAFLRRYRLDTHLVLWKADQRPLLLSEDQPGFWFHGPPNRDGCVGRPYLTLAGVAELKAAAACAGHPQWIKVVEQRHGDAVRVPPGWMHQVRD
jgi:hypothetical protein